MDKKDYPQKRQKPNNREKGTRGEDIAVEYLKSKNYKIVKRNFHFGRHGEIDIIALDGDVLAFVEVKLRGSGSFGDALMSITASKQKKLRRAAEGYFYVNKIIEQECRFDVIVVDVSGAKPEIEHIPAAF